MVFEIQRVTKQYGSQVVLDIDRVGFKKGSIYGLLGPNGAGKSTLLRILAFLEQPTSGKVVFNGQPVAYTNGSLNHLRRRVGLVHQHPILFTTSVAQNIDFGLRIRGLGRRRRHERVHQALTGVGLQDLADYPAHLLSGGQTQRAALARAWALNPEVLLCDEPCASVDVEHQRIVRQILQDINRSLGTTIIFTTHDQSEADALAQDILYLEQGRLSTRPLQNVFDAQKTDRSTHAQGTIQIAAHITLPLAAPLPQTESFKIHIDPDQVTLHKHPQADCYPGRMQHFHIRDDNWLELTLDLGIALVVRMPRRAYGELQADLLDPLWVRIPPRAISVMDLKAP